MPERDTRFPSATGYYFSRRIFPQMNFMKTVFALLINRSSSDRRFSSRVAARARNSRGRAAAFSNNIVSETPRPRGKELRFPPPSSPGFFRVIRDLRDLRKPAATLPLFLYLFSRRRKGAPGKIVGR